MMSLAVDKYLLESMKRQDDMDLMIDTDVSGVIDFMCGYNEETGTFQDTGVLFPPPIHKVD